MNLATFQSRYGSKVFPTISGGGRKWVPESAIDAELIRRASEGQRGTPKRAEPTERSEIRPDVRTFTGATSASAFKLFREGRALVDVVIELEIPPEIAEHLWEKYRRHSRAFLVDATSARGLKALLPEWTEPDPTGRGLLAAINRLLARKFSEAAEANATPATPEELARFQREIQEDDEEAAASRADNALAGARATRTPSGARVGNSPPTSGAAE